MFFANFLLFFIASFSAYSVVLKFSDFIAEDWLSWEYPSGYIPHALVIHAILALLFALLVSYSYPVEPEYFSAERRSMQDFVMGIAGLFAAFSVFSCIVAITRTSNYQQKKFHQAIEPKKPLMLGRKGAAESAKKRKWWHLSK